MREDQDAEGSRGFDEARRGDGLAGRRRMTEPVAADRARVRAGPAGRLLLGFLERVIRRILGRLVVLFLLDDRLLERDTVPVRMPLMRRDQLGQHPGERVDLVAAKLRSRGEVRRLLGEHAFEPEHQAVFDLPGGRRLPQARFDLGDRVVERSPARRSRREDLRRILSGAEERLTGPGFGSEGGGCQAVRGLRHGSRNLCRLLHARSASMRCNESTRADSRTPSASRSSSIPRRALAAEAAEHRERVAGLDLVDELAAGLDLAVDPARELRGLLAVLGAGDHVREGAGDAVSRGAELVGELPSLVEALALDADLPGRVAALEQVLFDVRLRRLVVPAVLVVEPVLGHEPDGSQAFVLQLLLDDAAGLFGLQSGGGVDEHRVSVLGNGEPLIAQLGGQLIRVALREPEPLEQAAGSVLVGQLDPDAPVVGGHQAGVGALMSLNVWPNIRSLTPVWSRCFVIPPRKNGQPAPSRRHVSTSAASATTPSSSSRWISSATASRTRSTISSRPQGSRSTITISSFPAA